MDYQTAISAACRTLTARGSLTLTTGYTYALSADDILSFRFEEGVQGGDMLLGGAVGAHGQLTLASPAGALSSAALKAARGRTALPCRAMTRWCTPWPRPLPMG